MKKDDERPLGNSANPMLEKAQRKAYLNGKGINPNSNHQLDLLFPDTVGTRGDLRHIPNDYARSSLFTTRNKAEPRQSLVQQPLFHYNETVSILYTGVELRADDDELVWLQIINYGSKVVLGEPFEFSVKDLVRDIGWTKNGRNYDRARACISRLKANEILALNTKAYGTSGAMSMIQNYTAVNDAEGKPVEYRVWIAQNLIYLFAGNTFTSHNWETYRELTSIERRLADYLLSHKHPYPLGLDKFKRICGSTNSTPTSWRQQVKKACAGLEAKGVAKSVTLTKDDKICAVRE